MKKEILKAALMAGLMGLIASFLVNYFIVPVPENELVNAFGNGMSGLMSGFMGAYMALKPKKGSDQNV